MQLEELQTIAFSLGLVIKIQVRETLGLCFFKIVIAERKDNIVKIWGEMKGWTLFNKQGIQLDTLRILSNSPPFVSELIWASTMAWAIDQKNSEYARLLAIYDTDGYSKKLVRYFKLIGFKIVKEVGSSPIDLLLRLVWGGAGTLMKGNCFYILKKIEKKLLFN
ncbi:hypothetical protein OA503_04875 [Prochlorococcus sp. AH-716-K03]|nr:hypothetical protein [Prochlorococcus sp. AH-716-K03]